MITQHTYFNLDAFANPSTQRIWNHTLHLPHSHLRLSIDSNALPTGEILSIPPNLLDDFYSTPRQLGFGDSRLEFATHCGSTCSG
jgi:aldose 1-epimerase